MASTIIRTACFQRLFFSLLLLTIGMLFFKSSPQSSKQPAKFLPNPIKMAIFNVDEIQFERQKQVDESCAKMNDVTVDHKNGVLKHIDWEYEIKFKETHKGNMAKNQFKWLYIVKNLPVNYCKYVFYLLFCGRHEGGAVGSGCSQYYTLITVPGITSIFYLSCKKHCKSGV